MCEDGRKVKHGTLEAPSKTVFGRGGSHRAVVLLYLVIIGLYCGTGGIAENIEVLE